jgi:hypothetical protein
LLTTNTDAGNSFSRDLEAPIMVNEPELGASVRASDPRLPAVPLA